MSSPASFPPHAKPPDKTTERRLRVAKEMDFLIDNRGDYRVDRSFLDFGNPTSDAGWKLHVVKPGARWSPPDLPDDYRRLLQYLCVKRIPHKLVSSMANLEKMERDATQVGKFLTIYPEDNFEMMRLLVIIEVFLTDPTPRPTAPQDHAVGDRGIVSARWGGLTSELTIDQQGHWVKDRRDLASPGWIRNPFIHNCARREGWYKRTTLREVPDMSDWVTFDPSGNKESKEDKGPPTK